MAGLETITNKTGLAKKGVSVVQLTNIVNEMSPILRIKILRDFRGIYKYGKVIFDLRDAANRPLPDDTILELRYSQRDAVTPIYLSVRLTDVYILQSFNAIDQTKAENLLELTPLVEGVTETVVEEDEIIEIFIRSSVVINHANSKIELYNWDIRQVK